MNDKLNQTQRLIPKHVAIIMDGNHRWARQQQLPGLAGHRHGARNVRPVVEACGDLGVTHLTLFAFSTENWQRPKPEIDLLMELVSETIQRELQALHERDTKLDFIGDRSMLPREVQRHMKEGETVTQNNKTFRLIIALNYGGRWDIVQAAKSIATDVETGDLASDEIDETEFSRHLALPRALNIPKVDLCIRTGGDVRISNFLLWELAYAELFFTDTYWPDFGQKNLLEVFDDYSTRHRRFGTRAQETKSRASY